MKVLSLFPGFVALLCVFSFEVVRAATPLPRTEFLSPETPTTDDPRRVPTPPEPAGPKTIIALTGGRVFDGTGEAARAATVIIEGKRILAVEPAAEARLPSGAKVIAVDGATILPGLIDLHTHVAFPMGRPDDAIDDAQATLNAIERLRAYAESGITSVRDCASQGTVLFRLKDWIAADGLPLPRVFASGQVIVGRGGHAAEPTRALALSREASGPDDWREAVREQFERGADFIKIASHFSQAEIAAAVEEAHALGLRVTVDAETFYIQWAVEAGVDMVEHPLPRSQATIRAMKNKQVGAVPTLVPYMYIADAYGGYFGSTSRRFTMTPASNRQMLEQLRAAKIKLGVGTDLIMDWHRHLPYAYITELEQFIAAGYSAEEALIAATRTNAELLGMADKLGTLQAGKLADVLVAQGEPDRNIRDLANVRWVIRNGVVVVEQGRQSLPARNAIPWENRKR